MNKLIFNNHSKIIKFVIIISFFLNSCNKETLCVNESLIDPNKACTKEYRPVCGCDGITHANPCIAEGNGVTEWTEGTCD